jgi:hypothetical protein
MAAKRAGSSTKGEYFTRHHSPKHYYTCYKMRNEKLTRCSRQTACCGILKNTVSAQCCKVAG